MCQTPLDCLRRAGPPRHVAGDDSSDVGFHIRMAESRRHLAERPGSVSQALPLRSRQRWTMVNGDSRWLGASARVDRIKADCPCQSKGERFLSVPSLARASSRVETVLVTVCASAT